MLENLLLLSTLDSNNLAHINMVFKFEIFNFTEIFFCLVIFNIAPGVNFSILKVERFAVCPTFLHEFVAHKLGELLVGRTATFDRAISMNVAERLALHAQ